MPMTFHDICDKMKMLDEITVVELLNLTAEDLVMRCLDIVEEKADELEGKFDEK